MLEAKTTVEMRMSALPHTADEVALLGPFF